VTQAIVPVPAFRKAEDTTAVSITPVAECTFRIVRVLGYALCAMTL